MVVAVVVVVVVLIVVVVGATRGVLVSTCAFLACHQCWSVDVSLNFRVLVCGIF